MQGQTTRDNLYAVYEVAFTGLHGANRLASISLLEGVVLSFRAAQHISTNLQKQHQHHVDSVIDWYDDSKFEPNPAPISQDTSNINNIMWNYVSMVGNKWRFERAMRELRNVEKEIELLQSLQGYR